MMGGWGQERFVQRPLRVRAGQQGTRAQRGYTVPTRAVRLVCGFCSGTVCRQAMAWLAGAAIPGLGWTWRHAKRRRCNQSVIISLRDCLAAKSMKPDLEHPSVSGGPCYEA